MPAEHGAISYHPANVTALLQEYVRGHVRHTLLHRLLLQKCPAYRSGSQAQSHD